MIFFMQCTVPHLILIFNNEETILFLYCLILSMAIAQFAWKMLLQGEESDSEFMCFVIRKYMLKNHKRLDFLVIFVVYIFLERFLTNSKVNFKEICKKLFFM